MQRTVYLGLGSNIGDRFGHLSGAIGRMAERGLEIEAISSAWETEPVGPAGQGAYLNAVIALDVRLPPRALLDNVAGSDTAIDRCRAIGEHLERQTVRDDFGGL